MLETVVLPIVQSVLGNYITDWTLRNRNARSRAELMEQVTNELRRIDDVTDQLTAVQLAVQEIDEIVRRDTDLKWKNDELVVSTPRLRRTKKEIVAKEALAALEAIVDMRRKEIALSPPVEVLLSEAEGHPLDDPDLIRPREGRLPHSSSKDLRPQSSHWRARAIDLKAETIRERGERDRS